MEKEQAETWIRKRTFVIYTALFFLVSGIVFSGFVGTSTSFIWNNDGIKQHYLLFHDYLERLRGMFSGNGFSLWDWSIGMGADVLYSYGYYVVGDPFVYIGLLFPVEWTEFAYHLVVLLRLYAIGLSFLFYVRRMKLSHQAGLLSVMIYTFTHYSMMNVIRHPFFLLPMIWYPLLCIGIEKIFHKESPLLFVLAVALSALSNFYFFYKLTLLIFFYASVRYLYLFHQKTWVHFWQVFFQSVRAYIIGIMLAGALFVPMVASFLGSTRGGGETYLNPFVYPLDYYPTLIKNVFLPGSYLWAVGGFSVFILFSLPFIWRRKGKLSFVPPLLTILGLGTLFPFFGSLMNGFSGPYNRYTFVLPFFLSLCSGYFFDRRQQLKEKQLKTSTYLLTFFTVYLSVLFMMDHVKLVELFPLLIGWGVWVILKKERKEKKFFTVAILLLVIVNMAGNNMIYYYPFGSNVIASRLPYGTAEDEYRLLFDRLETLLPDPQTEPYRVGVTSEDAHVQNQFIYLDLMGLNSYLSLTNGSLSKYSEDLETSQFMLIQPLRRGFDDRRFANHQLGVRYMFTDKENMKYLPASYEVIHQSAGEEDIVLAETKAAFPLAYAVDTWMPHHAFEQLNPVEKEALLMTSATTVEPLLEERVSIFQGELPVETMPFRIVANDGLEIMDRSAIVTEKRDEVFTFVFEDSNSLRGKDVYIYLEGIEFEPVETPFWKQPEVNYKATVTLNDLEKEVYQSPPLSFSSYFKRNNILFNMGYMGNEALGQFSITLSLPGTYHFENIEIYTLEATSEMDERLAQEKRENQLHFTTFTDDLVEGTIIRDEMSFLVTSIPYTKGWSVFINGEEVETLTANSGFIGVQLPEGEYNIRMVYQTPYLKAGILTSGLGLLLLGLNIWIFKRKKE